MARTINEEERKGKRKEILDTAQGLVFAKGYEDMTIQDILMSLEISSGAFYHYFESKQALLEALADRMQDEMEQLVLPVVQDTQFTAVEKIEKALGIILRRDISKNTNVLMMQLLRIWFTDENALLRQKVDAARIRRLAPLITEIVRQGSLEGSFNPTSPDLIGELILFQIQGFQYALASRHAAYQQDGDQHKFIQAVVTTYDANMKAIERLLDIPQPILYRAGAVEIEEAVATDQQISLTSQGNQ